MGNAILTAQKSEITEHFVYQKLSQSAMDPHNKSVLKQISYDKLRHFTISGRNTKSGCKPNKLVWKYCYFKNIRDNIWNKANGEGRRKGSGDL